ncbi:MAG: IMPACT family protein [Clostridiales Family XIII bacterium]|nr:IMPACT family protein [Clostridiales Family XIII bacterium]
MILYRTVAREAEAELSVERSRFIGCVCPAASREEAEAFFARRRALHRDATHNVPAFSLGDRGELQWASDDGEPQGTAGAPVARLLAAEGITNAAVMVTRYFGGVKLGTGGLVRAYTATARLALAEAGVCEVREQAVMEFRMDYQSHGRLRGAPQGGLFRILGAEFLDKVTLTVAAEPEAEDEARALVLDLTSGRAELLSSKKILTSSEI